MPATDFIPSYVGLRSDLLDLLPTDSRSLQVLDVGCATGVSGRYLLEHGVADRVYGIEYNPDMAIEAKKTYEKVLVGDVETMDFTSELAAVRFDCILFGDVLEHLRAPAALLDKLAPLLKPGGHVIISVPNMQHVSALWQLGVKGDWPENDRGIFDRTHLRVFTRKRLLYLVRSVGFEVVELRRNFRFRDKPGSEFPVYGRLLKWFFPDYYTFQYLVLARKPV